MSNAKLLKNFLILLCMYNFIIKVCICGNCADGWLEYGSHCYFFNDASKGLPAKNWTDSSFACQQYGGNLLSIADHEENMFIVKQFNNDTVKKQELWIGLNFIQSHNDFAWSDNTSLQLLNWGPGQPDNYFKTEYCVAAIVDGQWNDQVCYRLLGFICKVKIVITYFIEPYGLPNCFLDVVPSGTNLITYNCSGGMRFLLVKAVNGNSSMVSFKSAKFINLFIRHYAFVLYLHTLYQWGSGPLGRSYYIRDSVYDSYNLIQSNLDNYYLWRNIDLFKVVQGATLKPESSFKFVVCDLNIKEILGITRYIVNVTIELLAWSVDKKLLIKYGDSINDSKVYNVTGNSIVVHLLQNYTVHKFAAGVKNEYDMYVFGNTSYYYIDENKTQIDSCIYGFVKGNILNISTDLIGHGYNITLEFLCAPFMSVDSESVPLGFVKLSPNQYKYIFLGYLETSDAITYSVTVSLNKRKCFGDLPVEVPVRVSYQNNMGLLKVTTMVYRENLPCFDILPIISRDSNALPEYYGRGIYISIENSFLYLCINQHVESNKNACFYSRDKSNLWKELDVRVGSVIGHHLVTKQLYAIHRNQKTYLFYDSVSKRWLALSNQQFNIESNNFNTSMMINLEREDNKIFNLGFNWWLASAEGLFYGNDSLNIQILCFKWHH